MEDNMPQDFSLSQRPTQSEKKYPRAFPGKKMLCKHQAPKLTETESLKQRKAFLKQIHTCGYLSVTVDYKLIHGEFIRCKKNYITLKK